jgi:hypothetical protein
MINVTEQYNDFLLSIEMNVIDLYRQNPQLRDPDVMKAYDAAIRHYQRLKKGFPAQPVSLTGYSLDIYNAVIESCELRREKKPGETVVSPLNLAGIGNDIPLPTLLRCLEKLSKSVNFWFKNNGQRG